MRNAIRRPCVVCGSTGRRHELFVDGYDVSRCLGCAMRTLSPEPGAVRMEEFADGSGYDAAFAMRDDLMARHRVSLTALERFVSPGKLLDVGCGPGFLLEAARARGWDARGVDPSPFSVARARSLGFQAHEGMLEDLALPAGSFDAIALLQVIEHLPDPRALLAECARIVRPGGALLVATPNPGSLLARAKRERFNYWIPPTHCAWYPPRALSRLLEQNGFDPVFESTWSARTAAVDDGMDVVGSWRLGRRLPYRARRMLAAGVARAADRFKLGSITEHIARKHAQTPDRERTPDRVRTPNGGSDRIQ